MFRNLFGLGPKLDLKALKDKGAVILDVRTVAEYAECHVPGSINIPLDKLPAQLSKLPKDRPVIACCLSGGRSGNAVNFLKDKGYEAYNGGGWAALEKALDC